MNKIYGKEQVYSVRHPRNIWTVRFLAFFVLMFTFDISSTDSLNIKPKTEVWADNFIAVNHLDNSSERVLSQPTKPLIASNNLSVRQNSNSKKISSERNSSTKENNVYQKKEKVQRDLDSSSASSNTVMASSEKLTYVYLSPRSVLTPVQTTNEIVEPYASSFHQSMRMEQTQINATQSFFAEQPLNMFVMSGSIGPLMNYGSINSPSGQAYASSIQIENLEAENLGTTNNSPSNGFSAMLNIGMQIGRNFEVHTGLSFVQIKGSHDVYYDSKVEKYQTIITGVNTNNGDGTRNFETVITNVPYTNYFSDTLRSNYRLSSVEIPLILKYNFGKNRLSYFISSGVSTVLGSNYSSDFQSNEIENGTLNESKYGFKTFNLLVNMGIQYKITPNVVINLAPGYKYGIPVENTSILQSNTSTVGIYTGLSYYFK